MSFEFLIAKRYLSQKKETGFITLITYISITGLTIGIAALIITLGILNGFENAVKENILNFQAHIRVDTFHGYPFDDYESIQDRILAYPEVMAVAPFVEQACILRFGSLEDGVVVRGIDMGKTASVIDIKKIIDDETIDLSENSSGVAGVLIGTDFADRFEIVKDNIVVIASIANFKDGIIGIPRRFPFEVRGFIDTGLSEYDNLFAIVQLNEAQNLFGMPGQISGIDVKLHDISLADQVHLKINKDLSYPFYSRTWLDLNSTLFDWLRVQRWPILIAFGMIFFVGSINLVSTLILIVIEKQRDIGILKSMGASSKSIIKVFFMDGVIIWVLSSIFGSTLAVVIGYIQNTYEIISLSKEVYYISSFTIDLDFMNFVWISSVAGALCLVATIYPAWKASQLLPIEAIRLD
ncbi:ABC transporter permease [candidate division KSB1 bacterium]|nr:ABC transporter permease [candidate division KSB1 bacterium]